MTPEPRSRPDIHDRHGEPVGERVRETGVGPANRAMWTGAIRRAVIWGLVGAVIGLLVAWVPWAGIPLGIRLVGFGIGGFLAGSAAGFVYGAGRERDLDGEARRETSFAPLDHDHEV
jgi:hypothetical protein